jgi:hypothetical protein
LYQKDKVKFYENLSVDCGCSPFICDGKDAVRHLFPPYFCLDIEQKDNSFFLYFFCSGILGLKPRVVSLNQTQFLTLESHSNCFCVHVLLFIQKWQNADLNGKFKLPTKNEFIPTNFEILSLEKDATPYPVL